MNKGTIEPGMIFEDNTEYLATKDCYEFFSATAAKYPADKIDISKRSQVKYFPVAFYVQGKKNVTLDFCGATLYLHGKMQPFVFDQCENITLKNVVVEFDRSGFSEMIVLERGDNFFRARMKEGFPYEVVDGNIEFVAPYWRTGGLNKVIHFMQEFDKDTREGVGMYLATVGRELELEDRPWKNQTYCMHIKEDGGDLIFYGDKVPPFGIGNTVVYGHEARSCSSLATVDCKNVYIKNYRILNGCGMGIQPIYTENIYIDEFKCFMDERSHGVIANSADAIHALACYGDFVVENSIFQGMIDDALNVHSSFYRVVNAQDNQILAIYPGQSKITNKVFDVGDRIKIFRGSTREEVFSCVITDLKIVSDEEVLMTVDKAVKDVQAEDVIENVSTKCNLVIRNCRFDKANTHIRIQTNTALIENCLIALHCMITGDTVYWYESAPVEHCVFRNCAFVGDRGYIATYPEIQPTAAAPYYHGHLKIENCTFDCEETVYYRKSKKLTFQNNRNTKGKKMRIVMEDSGEAVTQADVEVCRKSTKE